MMHYMASQVLTQKDPRTALTSLFALMVLPIMIAFAFLFMCFVIAAIVGGGIAALVAGHIRHGHLTSC